MLPASQPTDSFFNLSGFLSKVVDTGLDLIAANNGTDKNKVVGTVYPTGQTNTGAVAAVNAATPINYTPWLIGGGALVALVLVIAVAGRK